MAKKIDANALIFKKRNSNGRLVAYRRADGKTIEGLTYSFTQSPVAATHSGGTDLAFFQSGNGKTHVALSTGAIYIVLEMLPDEMLSAINEVFPDKISDGAVGKVLTLNIPENENNIKINGSENTFEVEIDGEDGQKYKCFIDPLGLVLNVQNADGVEKNLINTRPEIEEFVRLVETNPSEAQKMIVNCQITPALLEVTLNKNNRQIETPENFSKLPIHLIDMYFQTRTRDRSLPKKNGCYTYQSEDSAYSLTAIPAADGSLVYFARQGDDTYICNGNRFQKVLDFRFTKHKNEPIVTFSLPNKRESSVSIKVPLVDGAPSKEFFRAVAATVGGDKAADSSAVHDTPFADWKTETASVKFIKPVSTSGYAVRLDAAAASDATHSPDRTEHTGEPPHEDHPHEEPPHASVGGVRSNPYVAQPQKPVKKQAKKLNNNAILYGGGTLGLFLMFMLLVPVVGPFLCMAGAGILTASMLISANIHVFNDNPYNNLVTTYINNLNKSQNEAESQAGKFWQAEVDLSATQDKLAAVEMDTFKQSAAGAMFAKMFDTPEDYNKFWERSFEDKQKFLADLQTLMAAPDDATLAVKQQRFLSKYGIDTSKATSIFGTDYEILDPRDPSGRTTVSAREAIAKSMQFLKDSRIPDEQKARQLQGQVGDIVQFSSGLSIERIMSQNLTKFYPDSTPEEALDSFIKDNATLLARRMLLRPDITKEERVAFFSKLTEEQADLIKNEMQTVKDAIDAAENIGVAQKGYDDNFKESIAVIKMLEKIAGDKGFDEKKLKTYAQTQDDVKTLLYAIANEDAKRNFKALDAGTTLKASSLNGIYGSGEISADYSLLYLPAGMSTTRPETDKHAQLLQARADLFQDPDFLQLMADDLLTTGQVCPLLTMTYGTVNGDSYEKLLNKLQGYARVIAKPDLLAKIKDASGLDDIRKVAKQEITSKEIARLYKKITATSTLRDGKATREEIEAKIGALKTDPKFAYIKDDEDSLKYVATLLLDGEKHIIAKATTMGTPEDTRDAQVKAAKKELDDLIVELASGKPAEKLLAQQERKKIETATTAAGKDSATTRAKASHGMTEMFDLLKQYGLKTADFAKIVKAFSSFVDDPTHPAPKNKATLIKALFEKVHGEDKLSNATDHVAIFDEKLSAIARRASRVGVDITTPEGLKILKAELTRMRKERDAASREQLEPMKKIAGKTQVDYVYDVKTGKQKERKDAKGLSHKQKRAEKRYSKAVKRADTFLDNAKDACEHLDTLDSGSTPPSAKKAAIISLKDIIKDDKDLKGLVKLDLLEAGLSWDKLESDAASGRLTTEDIKKLKKIIKKALKKKDKKISSGLKKSRKKAAKGHSGKQKGVTAKDIDNNENATTAAADQAAATQTKIEGYDGLATSGVAQDAMKSYSNSSLSHKVERE